MKRNSFKKEIISLYILGLLFDREAIGQSGPRNGFLTTNGNWVMEFAKWNKCLLNGINIC